MSQSYAEYMSEHVRLAVLRLLADQPTYSANDSVLTTAVAALGLSCTRDQMRAHLAWLGEIGMVTLLSPLAGVTVATLTERGGDVAQGRSIVPGILRPSPKG
ncbi:ArsR family transcriptional regulator [Sphingobium yanoikuyae]|uniref:VpaChn25_0724 family phage protein n=1 Tax=Sphingobium yanoikuyae TaxID=13690 RepID=UPI0026E9D75B|nr:ArsR family transcriptional regulator [Sphingobium yanoikuyae]